MRAALLVMFFTTLPLHARADAEWRALNAKELPAEMKGPGELKFARAFEDKAGSYVVTLWRTMSKRGDVRSARVQVDLWQLAGEAAPKLLRRVKDAVSDCEDDLLMQYVPPALRISDVDGDGANEVTFVYRYTCTTDVSPFVQKLLLLEGKDKYALRGSSRIAGEAGEHVGGEFEADASFKKAPRLLAHATKVWGEVVSLDPDWSDQI